MLLLQACSQPDEHIPSSAEAWDAPFHGESLNLDGDVVEESEFPVVVYLDLRSDGSYRFYFKGDLEFEVFEIDSLFGYNFTRTFDLAWFNGEKGHVNHSTTLPFAPLEFTHEESWWHWFFGPSDTGLDLTLTPTDGEWDVATEAAMDWSSWLIESDGDRGRLQGVTSVALKRL